MKMDVIDRIFGAMMANPEQHNQAQYNSRLAYDATSVDTDLVIPVTEDRMPPCGTTSCAVGFMVFTEAELGTVLAVENNQYVVRTPDGMSVNMLAWAINTCEATDRQARALFGAKSRTPEEWYATAKRLNDEEVI